MKVDTAIFGQVSQGHGLRRCSSRLEEFELITSKLDLPDALPSGLNLPPYLSGFPLDDYYIVARTFIDNYASRSGMVRSYALAIPIGIIARINNIQMFINLLPCEIVEDDDFSQAINADDSSLEEKIDGKLSGNIAELLVTSKKRPLVYRGVEGFSQQIAEVWQSLWPDMRKSFSFSLSLTPRDSESYGLVCVPEMLIARWQDHNAIIDESKNISSSDRILQAFLTGYEKYSEFCDKFGITLDSPNRVGLLDEAFTRYINIKTAEFSDYLSFVRLIEVLSPKSNDGTIEKAHLIQRFNELVAKANIEDLLLLRNFSGAQFSTSNSLWHTIKLRLCNYSYSINEDIFVQKLIQSALDIDNVVEEWRQSTINGVVSAFNHHDSLIFKSFWRWLEAFPEVMSQFVKLLNITQEIENALSINAPLQLSQKVEDLIIPYLADKKLLRLHGLLVALRYPAEQAFAKQLSIDTDISFISGLKEIASRADVSILLEVCTSINEPRITQITIDEALTNPSILNSVNYHNEKTLYIWTQVLEIDLKVWNAPNNPKAILYSLFNDYIDNGKSNHEKLIALLSKTPLADLCDYSRKSSLWKLLDLSSVDEYLAHTAIGWYQRALNMDFVELDLELENAICHIPNLDERMKQDTKDNPTAIIKIFERVHTLQEANFLEWLTFWIEQSGQKEKIDLELIGELVKIRGWKRSANVVLKYSKSTDPDLKPILPFWHGILPFWDWFGISPQTEDNKWEGLNKIVLELYPLGPEQENIWSRSGGDVSFLKGKNSGRNAWYHAINIIKNGAKPSPLDLINTIKQDYPNNRKISTLEKLFRN